MNPFKNESQTMEIDGLTLENRLDRVEIYGNLAITRDRVGLERAARLFNALSVVYTTLLKDPYLPDKIPDPTGVDEVKNPFENPEVENSFNNPSQ